MKKKEKKMLTSHFDALPILIEFVRAMATSPIPEVRKYAIATLKQWDAMRNLK